MADDSLASRVDQMRGAPRLDPMVANNYSGAAPAQGPAPAGEQMQRSILEQQRNVPMVQSNKDKPALPNNYNYQEVLNKSFEQAQEDQQRQQQMHQQMYMPQPTYENYQAPARAVSPTFWSENRYAIAVFIVAYLSMYYLLPKLTAMSNGREHLWLITAAVALADAWVFSMTVKYI